MLSYAKRLEIAIFVHSLFIISLQVIVMRILSLMQWDTYASLVISIAMLGFGVAGTVITPLRTFFISRVSWLLPTLLLVTALSIHFSLLLSQFSLFTFDSLLVFQSLKQSLKFVFFVILFFIPFFVGALVIGLAFIADVEKIHSLYFVNLLGSALGGLVGLGLLEFLAPTKAAVVVSVFPALAALLITPSKRGILFKFFTLGVIVLSFFHFFFPTKIKISQYKSLSTVMLLPDTRKLLELNSVSSQVSIIESAYLHYSTALSLQHSYSSPSMLFVFKNGNYAGVLPKFEKDVSILDFSLLSVVFQLINPKTALLPNSGTGFYANYLAQRGLNSVFAVESDVGMLKALNSLNKIGLFNPYSHPSIILHKTNTRFFVDSTNLRFDLILLPTVGSQSGKGFQNIITEEYELTIEAFMQYWQKLTDTGIMYTSCFFDNPPRSTLKLLTTIRLMLQNANIVKPLDNVVVLRSWNTIAVLVKKNAFTSKQLDAIENFCNNMGFDILLFPRTCRQQQKFHQLADSSVLVLFEKVFQQPLDLLQKNYSFKILPATDNSPYFSAFLSFGKIKYLLENFSLRELFFLETHYFVVWLNLLVLLIFSFILIFLPMLGFKTKGGNVYIFLYFGAIGFAYMALEILFIQRFVSYLGNNLYSTTAVLTFMLLFSGLGSLFSNIVQTNFKKWIGAIFLLLVLLMFLFVFMQPLIKQTLSSPLLMKLIVMIVLVGLPAFFMGMPFPLGMKFFNILYSQKLSWAWAVNGYTSVCVVPLATLLAIEAGAKVVFGLAFFSYAIAFLIASLISKKIKG